MNAGERFFGARSSDGERLTANERFKRRAAVWFWLGIMLATALHFVLLEYFPALTAADLSFGVREVKSVQLPPEVDIPEPPAAITRPAIPVVAKHRLAEDVTIAPTTFAENPVNELPPPPSEVARVADQPVFTPYTVAPRIRDRALAMSIVRQRYPRMLQDAGIGGTVVIWAYIDDKGVVQKCTLHTSCGNRLLDEAALSAVMEFAFVPALNYDRHVAVWISLPITFSVKTVNLTS